MLDPLILMQCPGCGYVMAKVQWDALVTKDLPCPNTYPGLHLKSHEFPEEVRPGCAWLANRFKVEEYKVSEYVEVEF